MGGTVVTPNPWVWHTEDLQGRTLRIEVSWLESNRHINGITLFRDDGCQFTKILIGTGLDGNPNNTDKEINVAGVVGETNVGASKLNVFSNRGLFTIDDLQTFQITAS